MRGSGCSTDPSAGRRALPGRSAANGRIVAVCHRGKVGLNAAVVREGWAFAFVEYATDYVAMPRR
jgi:hypothetical protein